MRVTVMGLGLFGGGEGAARHYASQGNVEVTVTDVRDEEALRPTLDALSGLPIRRVLGRHEEADFTSCDMLVVNPAVKPGNPYVELARCAGARVTTELELGLERAAERSARVLAVTGTNGKTTTATMLASVMSAADGRTRSGGNLGGSLLEAAGEFPEGAPLVLEVSSFQLHRLGGFPGLEVAVVTNLAPNHIDWHGSVEAYYAAKKRLLELLPPRGAVVLNGEDGTLRRWHEEFGDHPGGLFGGPGDPEAEGVRLAIDREAYQLRGGHDLMNRSAAVHAARFFGVSQEDIAAGMKAYRPPHHRLEVVARGRGLTFIDDSACTTPESAIAALSAVSESRPGPIALVAGGSDKGCSFDGLAREIVRRSGAEEPAGRVSGLAFTGEAGARLAEAVRRASGGLRPACSGRPEGTRTGGTRAEVQIVEAEDIAAAVKEAVEFVPQGGTVLLSPAAASLDEFRNYVERGRRFADTARRLAGEDAGPDDAGR